MRRAPSPNHGPRRGRRAVDMLVLHYTGMTDAEAALAQLRDPAAEVSAHYLIDEAGVVYRLVDEDRRAWHAGFSCWAGEIDVNSCSIGVELANPGHGLGYRDFPAAQMSSLIELAGGIVARHAIPAYRVLGHADIAPHRKADPGERFDWRALAEAGIGLWPADDGRPVEISLPEGLARLGYDVAGAGLRPTLVAFQRHWRPARVDGIGDGETRRRLAQVLDLLPKGA